MAKWKPRISIPAHRQSEHPVLIPKIMLPERPDAEASGHIRCDILWLR